MSLATPGFGLVLELRSRTETGRLLAYWIAGTSKKRIMRVAVQLVAETTLDRQHHEDTVTLDMLLPVVERQLAVESRLGMQHHEEQEQTMESHWIGLVLVDNKSPSERADMANTGTVVAVVYREPAGQQ
jgi:hypothetical protein